MRIKQGVQLHTSCTALEAGPFVVGVKVSAREALIGEAGLPEAGTAALAAGATGALWPRPPIPVARARCRDVTASPIGEVCAGAFVGAGALSDDSDPLQTVPLERGDSFTYGEAAAFVLLPGAVFGVRAVGELVDRDPSVVGFDEGRVNDPHGSTRTPTHPSTLPPDPKYRNGHSRHREGALTRGVTPLPIHLIDLGAMPGSPGAQEQAPQPPAPPVVAPTPPVQI
jgi:hypothetical protein